jgi:hypothetical protein
MSEHNPKPSPAELINRYCDGTLPPEELARLNERLRDDAQTRQLFYDVLVLHADLCWGDQSPVLPHGLSCGVPSLASVEKTSRVSLGRRFSRWSRYVPGGEYTVGAVVLLALAAAFWGLANKITDLLNPSRNGSTIVAQILDQRQVAWSDDEQPNAEMLDNGIASGKSLEIVKGDVTLQLNAGTQVTLFAPAQWRVDDENRVTLTRGRLMAQVPKQARGFEVITPTARIVDLGTKFDVEVSSEGISRVAVQQGTVDVAPTNDAGQLATSPSGPLTSQRLTAGQQVWIAEQKISKSPIHGVPSPSTPAVAGVDALAAAADPQDRFDVVAWYRMGEQGLAADPLAKHRELLLTKGEEKFIDAVPSSLRGFSQLAMQFGETNGARVAYTKSFAAPLDNFVLEAWARADSLETNGIVAHVGHSSFNGYGLSLHKGEWSVVYGSKATIIHGIKAEIGRWTHLALVREAGRTYLLVNGSQWGEMSREEPNPPEPVLRIGGLDYEPPLTFTGAIDEVRLVKLKRPFNPKNLLYVREPKNSLK